MSFVKLFSGCLDVRTWIHLTMTTNNWKRRVSPSVPVPRPVRLLDQPSRFELETRGMSMISATLHVCLQPDSLCVELAAERPIGKRPAGSECSVAHCTCGRKLRVMRSRAPPSKSSQSRFRLAAEHVYNATPEAQCSHTLWTGSGMWHEMHASWRTHLLQLLV